MEIAKIFGKWGGRNSKMLNNFNTGLFRERCKIFRLSIKNEVIKSRFLTRTFQALGHRGNVVKPICQIRNQLLKTCETDHSTIFKTHPLRKTDETSKRINVFIRDSFFSTKEYHDTQNGPNWLTKACSYRLSQLSVSESSKIRSSYCVWYYSWSGRFLGNSRR